MSVDPGCERQIGADPYPPFRIRLCAHRRVPGSPFCERHQPVDPAAALLRRVRMVGRYGWDGGYTHVVLLDDGEVLGPECVASCYREVSHATRHGESTGWRAVAVIALDGGESERCAHCSKVLS